MTDDVQRTLRVLTSICRYGRRMIEQAKPKVLRAVERANREGSLFRMSVAEVGFSDGPYRVEALLELRREGKLVFLPRRGRRDAGYRTPLRRAPSRGWG